MTPSPPDPHRGPSRRTRIIISLAGPFVVAGLILVFWLKLPHFISGDAGGWDDEQGSGCAGAAPTVVAEDEQDIVDVVYARLTEFSTHDSQLSFDLGEVRTYTRDDFDELTWEDIATLPGGRSLAMTRHLVQRTDTEDEVLYRPAWFEVTAEHEAWEDKTIGDWTVAEVLERSAASVPDAADVTRISTFRVDAFAFGRSRLYQAAFLWIGDGDPKTWSFKVVDNITQGLTQAANEDVASLYDPTRLQRVLTDAEGSSLQAQTCPISDAISAERNHGEVTTEGYLYGEAIAQARLEATCSCRNSCWSVCEVTVTDPYCGHTDAVGVPAGVSMSFMSTLVTSETISENGASCAGAFGCVRMSCPYGVCESGVQLSAIDGQVQFASGTTQQWTSSGSVQAHCPPCTAEGNTGGGADPDDTGEWDDMGDQEEFDL